MRPAAFLDESSADPGTQPVKARVSGTRPVRSRLKSRFLATVCAATMFLSATAVQAQQCLDESAHRVFALRSLQSEMMVAALSCNLSDRYNLMVTRYAADLAANGAALAQHFNRIRATSAVSTLDAFVTELANDASRAGLEDRRGFCSRAAHILDRLNTMPVHEIDVFALAHARPAAHAPAACPAKRREDLRVALGRLPARPLVY